MRVEHLFPHERNKTQIFVNCAQLNIIGNGGGMYSTCAYFGVYRFKDVMKTDLCIGKPTQFARFPGTYKINEPGINIPTGKEAEVYADYRKYGPAPGPPVWTG